MNAEEKIYNKIKNASHKGEKDFPGMDKVWNRVEEKLDNKIVLQKKNSWKKLAIAATVLLSFSIIYNLITKEESNEKLNSNTQQHLVSTDSVEKIIEKSKEVVVDNNTTKKELNSKSDVVAAIRNNTTIEKESTNKVVENTSIKLEEETPLTADSNEKIMEEVVKNSDPENEISYKNSTLNSSSSNNDYLATGKTQAKLKTKPKAVPQQNKDLVVINGVAMGADYDTKKELSKLSSEEIDTTYLNNPLYIINGIEYSEASLFGKNTTSPYAPLDKQKITSTTILQAADATKIYGKKGKNGIVIITTKNGKPTEK